MASIGSNTKPRSGFLGAMVQLKAPVCNTRKDIDNQIKKYVEIIHTARKMYPGLELIIFPEYGLQGLNSAKWLTDEFTFELKGKEIAEIAKACKETKMFAEICFLERNEDKKEGLYPFDSAIIINDKGETVLHYRKLEPWVPVEPWTPGNLGVPVCDGPGGSKLAVEICHDGMRSEIATEAAYKGANIIIHPAAYPETYISQWEIMNRANAWQNMMYTLNVSIAGWDGAYNYMGKAMAVNFDGSIIVEGSRTPDELITFEINPKEADEARITWGSDNNIYQLGHRGYDSVAGGRPLALSYMKDLVENKFKLPWEKEVVVVDGSAYGYKKKEELSK